MTFQHAANLRERSLLGGLDPEAFVVEVAALLDVLGAAYETVRLRVARDKAALFAQDLRAGQAARGLDPASGEARLPGYVAAEAQAEPGVDLLLTGWMCRHVAGDLEAGRSLRLGSPPLVEPGRVRIPAPRADDAPHQG